MTQGPSPDTGMCLIRERGITKRLTFLLYPVFWVQLVRRVVGQPGCHRLGRDPE